MNLQSVTYVVGPVGPFIWALKSWGVPRMESGCQCRGISWDQDGEVGEAQSYDVFWPKLHGQQW